MMLPVNVLQAANAEISAGELSVVVALLHDSGIDVTRGLRVDCHEGGILTRKACRKKERREPEACTKPPPHAANMATAKTNR